MKYEVTMYYGDKKLMTLGQYETDLKARLAICDFILEERKAGIEGFRYKVTKID